jgi:hypothetical protein
MNGRTCDRQKHCQCLLYGTVTRWADDESLAVLLGELEVVRRPAGFGPSRHCGRTPFNRGLCISLLTLAIVVLGDSLELFLFFFVIPQY